MARQSIALLAISLSVPAGCAPRAAETAPPVADAKAAPVEVQREVVAAGAILNRCIARYSAAQTLDIEGSVEDYLAGPLRKRDVRIVLRRPNWARIDVGGNAVVVHESDAWTFSVAEDRFGKYRVNSLTPALTAAKQASDGVVFFCIDLFVRGDQAFGLAREEKAWYVARVEMLARRPCYVLACRHSDRQGRWLSLWIDQDDLSLRGWELVRKGTGQDEWPVVRTEYGSVRIDEPLGDQPFRISRPFTKA